MSATQAEAACHGGIAALIEHVVAAGCGYARQAGIVRIDCRHEAPAGGVTRR